MNSCYKKFDIEVDSLLLTKLVGDITYQNPTFFEFDIKDKELLNNIIKSKLIFNIKPDIVNITKITHPGVSPHTDAWKTSLNFYLSGTSSSNITSFWKMKNGPTASGNLSVVFNPVDLELIHEVIIMPNDCYLLNTHTIHSVNVEYEDRFILRFGWSQQSFEDVLNSIEIIK